MQSFLKKSMQSRVQLQFTSQSDGFTEWASSIDIDCCHLENMLSVSSKAFDDCTSGHY